MTTIKATCACCKICAACKHIAHVGRCAGLHNMPCGCAMVDAALKEKAK